MSYFIILRLNCERLSLNMHFSHQGTHRVLLGVGVEHLRLLPVVQRVVNQRGQHHVIIEVRGVRVSVEIHRVQEDAEPDDNEQY